jgi:type III secretion system chaperone SycN
MSAETAVAEFGRLQGLEGLSLHPAGHVRLGLPSGDWLALDQGRGQLVLSLVAQAPHVTASALLLALQASDLRRDGAALPVRVGLHGQGDGACLVMAVRLPDHHGLSGQDLVQGAERLLQWHEQWRHRATGV